MSEACEALGVIALMVLAVGLIGGLIAAAADWIQDLFPALSGPAPRWFNIAYGCLLALVAVAVMYRVIAWAIA